MRSAISHGSRAAMAFAAVLLASVSASASPSPRALALDTFYRGHLLAEGKFVNGWTGAVRGVKAKMTGTWNAKARTLTLDEDIVYSDGETAHTVWQFIHDADGSYRAIRDGRQAEVRIENGVVFLTYPAVIGGTEFAFVDRMEQIDDKTVLNTADVRVFGFLKVGTVEMRIARQRK